MVSKSKTIDIHSWTYSDREDKSKCATIKIYSPFQELLNFIVSRDGLQSTIDLCMKHFSSEIRLAFCPVVNIFVKFPIILQGKHLQLTQGHKDAFSGIAGEKGTVNFSQFNSPLRPHFDWRDSTCIALLHLKSESAHAEFAFVIWMYQGSTSYFFVN